MAIYEENVTGKVSIFVDLGVSWLFGQYTGFLLSSLAHVSMDGPTVDGGGPVHVR